MIKTRARRLLCFLLALITVLMQIPSTVFADSTEKEIREWDIKYDSTDALDGRYDYIVSKKAIFNAMSRTASTWGYDFDISSSDEISSYTFDFKTGRSIIASVMATEYEKDSKYIVLKFPKDGVYIPDDYMVTGRDCIGNCGVPTLHYQLDDNGDGTYSATLDLYYQKNNIPSIARDYKCKTTLEIGDVLTPSEALIYRRIELSSDYPDDYGYGQDSNNYDIRVVDLDNSYTDLSSTCSFTQSVVTTGVSYLPIDMCIVFDDTYKSYTYLGLVEYEDERGDYYLYLDFGVTQQEPDITVEYKDFYTQETIETVTRNPSDTYENSDYFGWYDMGLNYVDDTTLTSDGVLYGLPKTIPAVGVLLHSDKSYNAEETVSLDVVGERDIDTNEVKYTLSRKVDDTLTIDNYNYPLTNFCIQQYVSEDCYTVSDTLTAEELDISFNDLYSYSYNFMMIEIIPRSIELSVLDSEGNYSDTYNGLNFLVLADTLVGSSEPEDYTDKTKLYSESELQYTYKFSTDFQDTFPCTFIYKEDIRDITPETPPYNGLVVDYNSTYKVALPDINTRTRLLVIPSEQETPATCISKGSVVYTQSVFEELKDGVLQNQSHTIETLALGHEFTGDEQYREEITTPTQELFNNAVNSSDLDFSTLTRDSKVYKVMCSRAQDAYEIDVKEVHTHVNADPVKENEINPTCTDKGSYDSVVYCMYCQEELTRDTISIDALGHLKGEPTKENEIKPTCEQDGSYEEVVNCTRCSVELSRTRVTVDKTGHIAGEPVIENRVEPTCDKDGHYDSVIYCTVCSKELSRDTVTIHMTGHDTEEREIDRIKPTCTEAGSFTVEIFCKTCDKIVSSNKTTIPALGHALGDWYTVLEPTYTSKGEQHRDCSRCTYYETRDLDMLEKEFVALVNGYIRDTNSVPVANASVKVISNSALVLETSTNNEGYFEFKGLQVGEYNLVAYDSSNKNIAYIKITISPAKSSTEEVSLDDNYRVTSTINNSDVQLILDKVEVPVQTPDTVVDDGEPEPKPEDEQDTPKKEDEDEEEILPSLYTEPKTGDSSLPYDKLLILSSLMLVVLGLRKKNK